MATRTLETDYLVIGAGAAGMAFTDALIANSDADVVIVDRRHAPGGHWNDAYPFVRLHQPAAFYGVSSLPLADDAIDRIGLNAGMYAQASAPEICGYYDRVMQQHLLPTGRVRYFPMCEYTGEHRFVSRVTGDTYEVKAREKLVDARYLEPAIPASYAPPFEVADGARCVPVNELARLVEHADRFVILGAGKTAIDACLWLLQVGVAPEDIRWIKPREAWLLNRTYTQGGELVGNLVEGLARQLEAAAEASSPDDLFVRLEAADQLLRVDPEVTPTMYKGPTMSAAELERLRRIEDVVRRGHVRRIGHDAIDFADGSATATSPRNLHVHCAAPGLNPAPAVPIFSDERIMLQPIRIGLIPFAAALVAVVEASGRDLAAKNRLCPPNRLPDVPRDWIRGTLIQLNADYQWAKEPDLAAWLERTRLNIGRGIRQRGGQPQVRDALARFAAAARPGIAKLMQLAA